MKNNVVNYYRYCNEIQIMARDTKERMLNNGWRHVDIIPNIMSYEEWKNKNK